MADLYFRCGSKSEADSLVESAREFAEKHEMSIEHVIFDRQDGRTIMLNMYADSAVYREPTTLLVRNYACLGNSEIQRLTMHKKLVRNGLTVVFEGGSPVADERKLILHTIKSYYSCGDEWERKYAGESQSAQVRTESFPGAKYAMPVPFGYRFENGAPIADPAESVVVRKIFEMYRHGTGVIEIAKEANRLLADIRNENGQTTADATCMQWSKTPDISVLRIKMGSHPIPQSFRITFGCMQRVSTDKERKRRKRGTDLCLQTSCPSASEQFCKRSILPLRTSLKSGFIVKTAK